MRFTINKNSYNLITTWEALPLEKAEKIAALEYDAELIEGAINAPWMEFTPEQGDYIMDVLAILSDCPRDVLSQTLPIHIGILFDSVVRLVNGLFSFNLESYVPKGVEKIRWKGNTYVIPQSLELEKEVMVCFKEPAKNITEAGNFISMIHEMKHKGISVMKYICAYYLKQPGDGIISDELAAKRAELFKDLPMSIVWEVFFCTYFSFINSAIDFRLSFVKPSRAQRIIDTVAGCWLWLKLAWLAIFSRSNQKQYGKLRKY